MRLGTLARKISITPSQLTAYLESESIDLPSGTNTKLTDEHIAQILDHYNVTLEPEPVVVDEVASESTEAPINSESEETKEVREEEPDHSPAPEPVEPKEALDATSEPKKETQTKDISDSFAEIALPHELDNELESAEPQTVLAIEDKSDEVNSEDTTESEPTPKAPVEIDPEIESSVERAAYDDSIEVIKPPKVVLPGLKVKGKIDLPEPKVKSEEEEKPKKEEQKAYNPDEIITTTGPRRERHRKPKNKRNKKYDKDYNPVEAERKRRAKEEKRKKEAEERRKKKAKAQHYKKTVTPVQHVTSKKKKPKKVQVKQEIKREQASGNVIQRFWRWMNT